MVEDISHERLRAMLREQGVSFQRIKTWKESTDPDYEGQEGAGAGPLCAGRRQARAPSWRSGGDRLPGRVRAAEPAAASRSPVGLQRGPRARPPAAAKSHLQAPARRPTHVRAYDLRADRLYGHIKPRKRRGEFLAFLRYVRSFTPSASG